MNYIIHIGLHKTGTTTLQNDIFSRYPDYQLLTGQNISRMFKSIVFDSPRSYLPDSVKNKLKPFLPVNKKGVIISDEMLSGSPTLGHINQETALKNLAATFPKAKIILSIREQLSLISSLYKHYVKQGGTKQIEDLLNFGGNSPGWNFINPKMFCYSELMTSLVEHWGKNNVLLLPLELMVKSFDEYLNLLSHYLDSDPVDTSAPKVFGQGIDNSSTSTILKINRFRKSKHNYGLIKVNSRLIKSLNALLPKNSNKYPLLESYREAFINDNNKLVKNFKISLPENYFQLSDKQ